VKIFEDFKGPYVNQLLKESSALDAEAAVFYGGVLKIQGKVKDAETYFRLAAESEIPMAFEALGVHLQDRGKSSEAVFWLSKAIDLGSTNVRIPFARALTAVNRGKEAEEVLDMALAEAGNFDTHHSRSSEFAWEYFYSGCIQKAIANFELAYRRSDQNPQNIAWLQIISGEEDKAMRWINDAKEKGLTEFADMLEGDYFFAKGMYKDAIRSYSKVTGLKTKDELLSEFDVLTGLRIATTYKAWGNSKEVDRWTSDDAGCLDGANSLVFSSWWIYSYHDGLKKLLIDDVMKLATDLKVGSESTNAMCNWGISYFRFGNLEAAIEKLESALNALDGSSESEASFFLMHAYAELGRIEDSAEMKRRCDASGGYEPSEIDRKRLGM
jgi:tetratricopeptide (TPR) repeat protein